MHILLVILGMLLLWLLQRFGRRGSALPGLIVEKLDKRFLAKTVGRLPMGVVLVTGTNGKTTTTKILSQLLIDQGLRVLTNETGSNFVRGVISTVVEKSRLSGRLDYDIAVFEQDEAYAAKFVNYVKPKGILVLNIARDQMDRFGEIDQTARCISQAVSGITDWAVLNTNDFRVANIADQYPNLKTKWFGYSKDLTNNFVSDDQYKSNDACRYFASIPPQVCLERVDNNEAMINVFGDSIKFNPLLKGDHNALNFTAALAGLTIIKPDYSVDKLIKSLETVQPVFGRGEKIELNNGAILQLQLVKNPASFKHGLSLLEDNKFQLIVVAVNDRHADGRDVSWLWDVDFEPLKKINKPIICGGVRGYDTALRLKHNNIDVKEIAISDQLLVDRIIDSVKNKDEAIIYCTYTAMISIRRLIKKQSRTVIKEGL